MQFNASPTTGGGATNFLKLEDKQSVTGVFRGAVHEFNGKWENKKFILDPHGISFRFQINFVLRENDIMVAKIFEQGPTVYNQLKELHAEYDLRQTVVKITRIGTGMDTTYSIMPVKKSEVTKDMEKQLLQVELQELGHKKEASPASEFAEFESNEAIPF